MGNYMTQSDAPLALVTGGAGFVGKALVKALLEKGVRVRSLSRKRYAELEDLGVECIEADLGAGDRALERATAGISVCFHTAAKVDMWGAYEEFERVNLIGTRNLLESCRRNQVPYFVYTSSPSVVAGSGDLSGVDESTPYPDHYLAYYPQTKAAAEREVLAANSESFKTIALRPHLIWGPGDNHLIPTVVERAKQGRLLQIGNGKNLVDFSFIEDCVAAHLNGWEALRSGQAAGGGAYFISQGEPMPLWEWVNQVLEHHNLPPVTRRVPTWLADGLALILEGVAKLLPGEREPLLTRFLVHQMASEHYFDISKAKRELGYSPKHSMAEAFKKTFG